MNLKSEDMLSNEWRLYPLAKLGYTVIATNFRGSEFSQGVDEAGGADVNDLANLGSIIQQYGDASDVSLFGWSMGGQKLLQLLLTKCAWARAARCCIVGAPSTNLLTFKKFRPELWDHWVTDFGATQTWFRERSVVRHVKAMVPALRSVPLLLMHGARDHAVDVRDTLAFSEELVKEGVTNFKLIVYPDDDHGMFEHMADVVAQVDQWIRAHPVLGLNLVKS